jgi:Ribbon-helix-helix protein, copG family
MTWYIWPIHEGILNSAAVALFVACAIAKLNIVDSTKYMAPYLVILFLGLLFITYVPWFTLVLPWVFLRQECRAGRERGSGRQLDAVRVWLYGMSMVKMTFTFDQETVDRLKQAAARLVRPQSYVVREAVREYADRIGSLSEQESRHLLRVFDALVPVIPSRPLSEVQAELREVRVARRRGGRRPADGR